MSIFIIILLFCLLIVTSVLLCVSIRRFIIVKQLKDMYFELNSKLLEENIKLIKELYERREKDER